MFEQAFRNIDDASVSLRKLLLESCSLHTVVLRNKTVATIASNVRQLLRPVNWEFLLI